MVRSWLAIIASILLRLCILFTFFLYLGQYKYFSKGSSTTYFMLLAYFHLIYKCSGYDIFFFQDIDPLKQ